MDQDGWNADFTKRDQPRLAVDGETQMVHRDVYSVEVRIRDVSATGFMAECAEPVRIGSTVSLEVAGIGAVDAQVRWQIGGTMGGRFVDPISLEDCEWTAVRAAA